ncbi:MAG: hypothetical protein RBG13Loki_1155 [Promethearchaeota archaeon CR_4]|nr:MAG: hypothetical protein RBG13Loki_1155 [Candidatus Lokiarchaeota archaeon CR_4]
MKEKVAPATNRKLGTVGTQPNDFQEINSSPNYSSFSEKVVLTPFDVMRLVSFLKFPPDGYGSKLRLEQVRAMYVAFLTQRRWA